MSFPREKVSVNLYSNFSGFYVCAEKKDFKMVCDRKEAKGWEQFESIPVEDDVVAFKTKHGRFVSAQKDGSLDGDRKERKNWEKFTALRLGNGSYAFKTVHDQYLTAKKDGRIMCEKPDTVGKEQQFQVLAPGQKPRTSDEYDPAYECEVNLYSNFSGFYLCAEKDHKMVADRKEAKGWETFVSIPVEDGNVVAFRTKHGRYVSAQKDGSLDGDRKERKGWEKFTALKQKNGTFVFKTVHDQYLTARKNGKALCVKRPRPRRPQQFQVLNKGDKPREGRGGYNPARECKVRLFAVSTERFVCAEKGDDFKKVVCNRKEAKGWETFESHPIEDGNVVAFKSKHGRFLSAQKDGDLEGNRKERKNWEKFTAEEQDDGNFAFKTHHGQYLTAKKNGDISCDKTDEVRVEQHFDVQLFFEEDEEAKEDK